MSAAVCPYCRTPIEPDSGEQFLCTGCGTPHHADCYTENGGCTVFGCSAAPADEQKVSVTRRDIAAPIAGAAPAPTAGNLPQMLPGIGLMPPGWNPNAPPKPVKAAPPPLPPGSAPPAVAVSRPLPRVGVGSMFFDGNPLPAPASSAAPAFNFDFEPDPNAKNRSTFIVLGALLGFFGAHNFYAGYKRKAVMQLCLTAFSLGFAGIMTWVWAVIDVCTVDRDSTGVKFKS
jgi:TM2 domain-containing membrane protein YozV